MALPNISDLILNLSNFIEFQNYKILSSIFIFFTSILMVSKIPTYSLKRIAIPRHLTVFVLLSIGVYFSLLFIYTFKTLLVTGILYLLFIPVSYFHFKNLSKKNENKIKDVSKIDISEDIL